MARRQPVQQPPPAQKVRLRYARWGPARFTSHRDFGRALERALRRADVPMAYSSGFSPHPRISYANAAPTGAASEAEYVELGLSSAVSPQRLAEALNEVLPAGFVVLDAAEALARSLGELLQAADWAMELPEAAGGALARAIDALLTQERHEVERMTKNGLRTFDVRRDLLALSARGGSASLRLRHDVPLVRPDDVLTALRRLEPELPASALLTRTAQGPLLDGEIGDPLRAPSR